MNKNKKIWANAILVLACLLLNIICYCIIHKVYASWIYISALVLIPLGSIISSLIGGRVPGILTTVLSVLSFYVIDKITNTSFLSDRRFLTIALTTTLICAALRYVPKRQKLFYNIVIALIISLVNIVVNYGYWKHVCGFLYSSTYDPYIIVLVPLVLDPIIVLACFAFTKGYRSKLVSYFDTNLSYGSNSGMSFPIGAKLTVATSIVVMSLVTVAVLNNSKTYYDRIAYTMDMEVANTALSIVAPYNPGDISFAEAWETAPEAEKERLIYQIATTIENRTSANTITKVEVVKTETNEDCDVISAKVIGSFYPYASEEGYMGASGIRYDDTEKSVDLNGLMYGDVHGWFFESDFFSYIFLDENYNLCVYMICREVEEIPAYAFNQLLLSLIVAMIVGTIAVLVLETFISIPLQKMTNAADAFVKVDEIQREKASKEFSELNIRSHDEVANLYHSFGKAMADVTQYAKNIKEQAENITQMQHNLIITMADIVESRDQNTGGHIRRTAQYVEIIAKELAREGKYPDVLTDKYIEDMVIAAPLHDIGKIHVSDTILNKPGRLTPEEFEVMKTHVSAGQLMLERATENLGKFDYLDIAIQMAGMHHEWWNGKGYPAGLQGEEIAVCARIMAVSDVFDAIISKRCYKDAVEFDKAFDIVVSEGGSHFDPVVVEAFVAAKEEIRNASI